MASKQVDGIEIRRSHAEEWWLAATLKSSKIAKEREREMGMCSCMVLTAGHHCSVLQPKIHMW